MADSDRRYKGASFVHIIIINRQDQINNIHTPDMCISNAKCIQETDTERMENIIKHMFRSTHTHN